MLTVRDLQVSGKKVLVRVDFNVPHKGEVISDDNRIRAAIPTIAELLNKGARVVLMSHLGKVDWKKLKKGEKTQEEIDAQMKKNDLGIAKETLKARLEEALGRKVNVAFSKENRGQELKAAVEALGDGDVLLVQNTRYQAGEEKCDPELSKEWASLVDAFVMDAFGSAHRAHASTYGVPEILKAEGKQVAIGYLVEKEVNALSRCVEVKKEDRPYVAILGGLKVTDKIQVIDTLLKKCDYIIIGGAMSYTFRKAMGAEIGDSFLDESALDYARKCLEEANGRIILPVDSVVTNSFEPVEGRIVKLAGESIEAGFQGVDIGPKSAELFKGIIEKAKMVFWNGPMGVFEQEEFQAGTKAVCEAIRDLSGKAFTVCGGGDSASAVKQFGYKADFSHVSTGGGASLEMIQNDGHLPGIDIIR